MKSHNINYNKITTEEEEEEFSPELDIKIDNFDFFNQEIFDEINDAREFPDKYAEKLELILKNLKTKDEKFLFLESVPFIYNDLYNSLNDAIKFLKSQKKLPSLTFLNSIADACDNLVDELVSNINNKNTNLTFEKRINNYGQSLGENYEIITWDMPDPEFLVINLILSDEDKSKLTRKVIFNPNLKYIGLSTGVFPPSKICSIINFCEEFYNEENPNPNPNIDQNKIKEKKNIYNSKTVPSKISKINPKEKGQIKLAKNSQIQNNDKNKPLRNKNDNRIINNNINNNNLRNPPKKNILKSIFDYDLDNFDEEEFFEKEFDTNYGKYEKEKNSHKKLFKTSATNENGQQTTITTTIVENVDKNGIKRGYYVEKEDNVNAETKNYINKKENERDKNERIEKEKRDMKILKDMERKEKERIEKQKYDKNRIKEIPIKLKGKKEFDENEYFDDEQYDDPNAELPEGAVGMHVKHKTITDSNGEPSISVTKTITYPDGSIQQFVNP